MEVLKNKSYKNYNYISRYSPFPFYYNKNDKKYLYGLTKQLGEQVPYVLHNLRDYDTLDSLSLTYYGRPDYWWIIADFNRIQDPFIQISKKMSSIKIPSLSNIYFEG